MDIALIILVPNPISILVAANLGYLLAAVLTVYGAVVLVVGALSAEITGYGGPVELAIGVGFLLLSLVLFVIRRRVQDRQPLVRDPRPAA
jgi:membrane protein implicated in regulation of membrane protease activity